MRLIRSDRSHRLARLKREWAWVTIENSQLVPHLILAKWAPRMVSARQRSPAEIRRSHLGRYLALRSILTSNVVHEQTLTKELSRKEPQPSTAVKLFISRRKSGLTSQMRNYRPSRPHSRRIRQLVCLPHVTSSPATASISTPNNSPSRTSRNKIRKKTKKTM